MTKEKILRYLLQKIGLKKKQLGNLFVIDVNCAEIFTYKYIPTYEKLSDNNMIEFVNVQNGTQLIGRLMILINDIGFEVDGLIDMWMNDEVWINYKSLNGKITISRDIYNFVFITSDNKIDLDKIENTLCQSEYFKRILTN